MLDAGDRACAMEVSSHALELHRADAIHFAAAIFTNLTQDHLDFHPTMEDYFLAKRRLFAALAPAACGRQRRRRLRARLAAELDGADHLRARRRDADYRAVEVRDRTSRGSRFTVARPATATSRCSSPLRGRVQRLQRARRARGGARARRADGRRARRRSPTAGQVPGRFETVDEGQPFAVLVDYAHTPDSLENVLQRRPRA